MFDSPMAGLSNWEERDRTMTRLPPALGVIECRASFTLAGQSPSVRMFFWRPDDLAWSLTDVETAATNFAEGMTTSVMPFLGSDIEFTSVQVTDLTSDSGIRVTESAGTAGGAATVSLPLNVAVRSTFNVAFRYRGGKGGWNLPGVPEGARSDARLLTTDFTLSIEAAVQGVASQVIDADYVAGPIQWVVPNNWEYGAHPPVLRAAALPQPVVSVETQQRYAARRRRLGRGVAGG